MHSTINNNIGLNMKSMMVADKPEVTYISAPMIDSLVLDVGFVVGHRVDESQQTIGRNGPAADKLLR